MGSAVTGLKAGLVGGVAYGAIAAILSYVSVLSLKSTIMSSIQNSLPANSPITANQVYQIALVIAPVAAVIVGILGGLLLGAIYGWVVERIPGGSFVIKGLFFGLVLWFIFSVLVGAANLEYGLLDYLSGLATGIVPAVVFGAILGYLYSRFLPKPEAAPAQL
jgi:vacuolar-type H+-ATPase subunit I/STV1